MTWVTLVFVEKGRSSMVSPIRVAVTGAAGQIGYSLIYRIASGEVFGPNQPVILHLVEVPPVLKALDGVHMELDDCAFPTLAGVVKADSDHLEDGFRDCNWVLCVGSVPRKAGMERGDLIRINGPIFTSTGRAIAAAAAPDVRVLVVGNPCNTNCLIAMNNAKGVPADRWFAMTMLDQNRATSQLAQKAGVPNEAMPDKTLSGQSLGRGSNGNFVLTGVSAELRAAEITQPVAICEEDYDGDVMKILTSSPIATAMLGLKVGDKVEVDIPRGKLRMEIVGIQ